MLRWLVPVVLVILFGGCREREPVRVVELHRTGPSHGLVSVMSVLSAAGASGSIEFSGVCDARNRFNLPGVQKPRANKSSPVELLRESFANEPRIRVSQEGSGLIRMAETKIPRDLLNFRISHLSFELPYAGGDVMYDSHEALRAVLATPEVQDYMEHNQIDFFERFEQATVLSRGSPDSPQISGSLTNVTLSQALDRLLQSFPGVWVYEECQANGGRRVVDLAIYENQDYLAYED